MSYLTNINLQQAHGEGNEQVYFSRITQQWEPVWFYATMLKKLSSFSQAIDRCASSSRELVWSHIFTLYNQPNRKCMDLFSPIIDEWCHNQSIDLSAIEIMYTSFLQVYNQYPGLFEDMLSPPTDSSMSSYSGMFPIDSKSEFKKEVDSQKQKVIKLNNTSLIWGSSFSASIQHFSLLLNWAPLLEKLPPNQKEAIWNTCQFFPLFNNEEYDRSSFRKTFLKWAGNLTAHVSHITILFAAIGFLRDKGIIKHQFFYPNTTIPVFNNGVKTQTPQFSSPAHQHFPPTESPLSPPSTSSPARAPAPSTSRPTSPSHYGQEFQPPLHHFYPSLQAPTHPVLPTLDTSRNTKSLPFESLSLPPLALPPTPTAATGAPSSTPAGTPSSSRLGLLALAAFQADDTEAPKQQPTIVAADANALTLIPLPIKTEQDIKATTTLPAPASTTSSQPTKDKQAAPTMKISKRKNSCSDSHDDEAKRPRTMNLSHILCS